MAYQRLKAIFRLHYLSPAFSFGPGMNTSFFPCLQRAVFSAILVFTPCLGTLAAENEVVVISPHWDGIKEETSRAFSTWHEKTYGQPVIIRWRETGGGTTQIIKLLRSEFQSGPSAGIDVLYGGGIDPFLELKKDHLLTRYDPPADTLAQIPATLGNRMEILDPGHEWFGASLSGFGIIVNEQVRRGVGLPPVKTWDDLADPQLKGWISGCDPRQSGSVLTIYETILQNYGWEKGWKLLMAMSANTRSFFPGAAPAAQEVGMGDAAYGVSIDLYGQAQVSYYGADNVAFILPEGETVITPDSIAILKNPPHPLLAQHFVEFVLSREGQLLWMEPKGAPGGATGNLINRMSVRPALYDELAGVTPIKTNPFKMSSRIYSNELGSKRRSILSVLIAAWMIDTHDAMVRSWNALHSPAMQKLYPEHQQTLLAQFLAPPCTEQELLRLAENDWKIPVKRTALTNRWQNEALARYKDVSAQLHFR